MMYNNAQMKHYFFEGSDYVVNRTFSEVLEMSNEEFSAWVKEFREAILYSWDVLGVPPKGGASKRDIIDDFNLLSSFPVHKFMLTDEHTGETNLIRNTHYHGNTCNQFFPTMLKTRIAYSVTGTPRSIYDHFADPTLFDKVVHYARRHFKRDSFYAYSHTVEKNNSDFLFTTDSFVEWIKRFEEKRNYFGSTHGYWIQAVDPEKGYTGYNINLSTDKFIKGTWDQLASLIREHAIPSITISNLPKKDIKEKQFTIRLFEKETRIFPAGFKAFWVSWCQIPANFPPLTAKFIWERYTEVLKDQDRIVVYDPSSGWGGRILGAMSVKDDRHIHYVGTDPNPDHWIEELQQTKYEYLADFFNNNTYRGNPMFSDTNTYDVYRLGSEVIKDDPGFQQYKGQVDMVFSSPPYWTRESYSEDENQSCVKFKDSYTSWRDGFLRPTLETCVEWLKPKRYLLWNVSDVKYGKTVMPIEDDSVKILTSLGMKHIETLKMVLASMPGGNRIDQKTGLPKCRNFCKVDGTWFKYEPVFVFFKE